MPRTKKTIKTRSKRRKALGLDTRKRKSKMKGRAKRSTMRARKKRSGGGKKK